MLRGGLEHGEAAPCASRRASTTASSGARTRCSPRWRPKLATADSRPARDILIGVVGDAAFAEALIPYCERVEIAAGDALIAQGKPSDDIFFIEAGRAAVELANGTRPIRLATLAHGAIVGEVAFYLSVPRSASVVAESTLVAWRFSRANLDRLRATEPEIAARFHAGHRRHAGRPADAHQPADPVAGGLAASRPHGDDEQAGKAEEHAPVGKRRIGLLPASPGSAPGIPACSSASRRAR